jgi:multicomponent Na+:H+ antiporter subunit D
MIEFPPGAILVFGALVVPFLRGPAFRASTILLPLLTLWAIWNVTDRPVGATFLDFDITLVAKQPATMVFATIFAFMAFAGALFAAVPAAGPAARRSRRGETDPEALQRFELAGGLAYAGSAIGVTFAGDLITMLLWWELMAIGSTLVVLCGGTSSALKAAQRYISVHLVGGVVLMAGIILHVFETGSIAYTNFSALESTASWLILAGILVNAAAPPFGSWLPDAYPEASFSGSVFLSAFTTKTAVYVLMLLFAGTELLIYVGAIMAVYGIVYAILENDMRRILAYSIVNQVGFMVCGIGIGTQMALNGAAAHAFAHIIYKALLLMSAGAVLYQTGKRKCTDLGGLYRTMPLTMICGTIGALAISSFPLTSGFTTKSMIVEAAAEEHQAFAFFVLTAASAGVFLHAGIKFPWFVFFQKDSGLRPEEPPLPMKAAMVLLAVACVVLGIYPDPLYAILPFPHAGHGGHAEGARLYEAYSFAHVVGQLQLLLFSGLAFFALLPMLKRTETITVDFDWFYRKGAMLVWRYVLSPVLGALGIVWTGITEGIPEWSRARFGPPQEGFRTPLRPPWGVRPKVALATAFLFVYAVVNLLM